MSAGFPVHQIGARHTNSDWQTRADTFRNANDVGLHIVMLAGKHLPGSTHPRLHFVNDQKNTVRIADTPQPLEKIFRSRYITPFALYCLNDNRGNFLRWSCCLEQSLLNPIECTLRRASIAAVCLIEWIAKLIRIGHVHDVECLSFETQAWRGS